MAEITNSSVTRTLDRTGTEIKAFLDSASTFIQAIALVDNTGAQIAVSGNPLYVSITGDSPSVVRLDEESISSLTAAETTIVNDQIDSLTSNRVSGLSASTITQLTGATNVNLGTMTGQLEVLADAATGAGSNVKILGDNSVQVGTTSNPMDIKLSSYGSTIADAFGRLKTAHPYTLADITNRYNIDELLWHTSTANGGQCIHTARKAAISLSASTDASSSAQLITLRSYRYQAGKGQTVIITGRSSDSGIANNIRRWGYYGDNNGIFFSLSGTDFGVTIRSKSTGTLAEDHITQSNFNLDTLDGNGQSGFTLDVTKGNIYWISFQWLGVGLVTMGVVSNDGSYIPCHEFQHANLYDEVYMTTAYLPLHAQNQNVGAVASATEFDFICASIISDGGDEPPQAIHSVSQTDFKSAAGADEIPVLSLRSLTGINNVRSKIEVIPTKAEIAGDDKTIIVRMYKNASLTGASWTAHDTHSIVEYDDKATAAESGELLDTYVISPDTNESVSLHPSIFDNNKEFIIYDNAGIQESLTFTIQRTGAVNGSGLVSLTWGETK